MLGFLNGYKTRIGAIGLMMTGLGMIAAGIAHDGGIDKQMIIGGFGTFSAGLSALGLGHKAEKIAAAVEEAKE